MALDVVTTTHDDGTATVSVAGEVDVTNASELRAALAAATAARPRTRVDLTATTYLDTAGVQVLAELAHDGVEVVVAADGVLARVLALTGLADRLVVREV